MLIVTRTIPEVDLSKIKSIDIPKKVLRTGARHYRNPKTLALSSKIPA